MELQGLPEALKAIMKERGWRQVDLAQELGRSQEWVSKATRGERDTPIGQIGHMLARVGWEVVIRPKGEKSEPVKRREFHDKIVKLAGGAAAGKAVGATFIPSARTTPYHNPEYVRLLAQRAARVNDEAGGASVAGSVLRQANAIEAASTNGGRELHTAASWFMRRASYVLRSADRHDTAAKLANSAILHSIQGADFPQQAAARAALSMTCETTGRNELAVVHAQEGLRIPEITDENRAWLHVALGVALSGIPHQERRSRLAIDNALSIEDLPGFDKADIMGSAGRGLHAVGARQTALNILSEAVELSATHSVVVQTSCLADQAKVALAVAHESYAAELMRQLSYLSPLIDSRRVDQKIGQLLHASAKWTHVPEIRQARDQLMSVARTY